VNVDRIAEYVTGWFIAARGQQVVRKDKDLMRDTGGVSKGRDREPDQKPPRDDVKERYKEKRLTPDEKKDREEDDREVKKPVRRHSNRLASRQEKEVERLMGALLKGTPFANKAYATGGYVRDEVLGVPAKDLDIVVEMRGGAGKLARFIYTTFPGSISRPRQMKNYPIWVVAFKDDVDYGGESYRTKGATIEIADTQKESFPEESSRQRVTEYGNLKEDAERRDFTVNMLMKDLTTGQIKDLTGTSVSDIKGGILRGHPGVDFNKILRDDPLRLIRLVRFQAKYGWAVPMSVMRDVKRNAGRIRIVSADRIREELVKIMELGRLARAIKFMKVVGLLKYVLPEIEEMAGTEQEYSKGSHQEGDVLKHTLLVLRNAKPGVENQLAALLHDVGKPKTQDVIGGLVKFLGHEKAGGEIAEAIMRRLRFERKTIKAVRKMVENHMRPHHLTRDDVGPKALRRFVRHVGEELIDSVLDLAEADALGNLPSENEIPRLRKMIEEVQRVPVEQKPPLDGNQIQEILGLEPGPEVGKAIQFLRDKMDEYAIRGLELSPSDAERLLVKQFA